MNLLSRRDLEEKESREDKHEKEHPVLDRTFDVTICIEDRQEIRAES